MSKKTIIPELVGAAANRRSFVTKLGVAAAAVGAMGDAEAKAAAGLTATDTEVFQFALNLEYLESTFYTFAVSGTDITAFGIGIDGLANGANPPSGGWADGGSKVDFGSDWLTADLAGQIASDERSHVKLLREALGEKKVARPNLNLLAAGNGFGGIFDFLRIARILEDTGMSAYTGSAPLLSPTALKPAARITAAEGEHVAGLRVQITRYGVPTAPPLDSMDILPPPSGSKLTILSVNPDTGLTPARTPGQILYLAYGNKADVDKGGFFPDGTNGPIRTSSGPA